MQPKLPPRQYVWPWIWFHAAMDPLTHDQTPYQGESQRTRRLRSLGLNAPDPDAAFDHFAHLAASSTQAPLAMVNFINDERQMFRGMFVPPTDPEDPGDGENRGVSFDLGEIAREAPINYGFCPHVVAERSTLALNDVFAYPRFRGNPIVNDMGIRAYLGTPLLDHTGTIIGTVCVADMEPRQWGRTRMDSMQRIAKALLSELRLRDSLFTQQQEMLAIFDNSPFPVMLTGGPNHLLRYANAEQGRTFGRVPEQSPGRQALPGLAALGVFDALDQAFRTGQTTTLAEARITSYGTGTTHVYSFTCTPVRLPPTGPVSGVLTVATNVTAQSHTDEELRQLAAALTNRLQQSGRPSPVLPQQGFGNESSPFLR